MADKSGQSRLGIPPEITRDHIIQAIKEIDTSGYPERNESRKYDLLFEGKRFPPKVVLSYANKYLNEKVLDVSQFSGGESAANKFLKERGFEILLKNEVAENSNLQVTNDISLKKYQDYSRKYVHEIFDKNSRFTPQSGTWGLRGIISHPPNSNDFIFFVTFGHKEGSFAFEESVTESGILTWQSEPKQKIRDSVIQKLIYHDYRKNSIQLFLRTDRNSNYKYLGQLAYVTHDNEREEPVHFKWQILDWELDETQAKAMGLTLIPDSPIREEVPQERDSLIQTTPPEQVAIPSSAGERSRDFIAKKVDFVENEQKNKAAGLAGEELVLEFEIKTLEKTGYSHITQLIEHVSKIQGDGAGYDIKSIDTNLQPKFIEVKTTVGGINTPFTITINELNFSQLHKEKYSLYRVYDFDKKSKTGKFYIIHGDISEKLVLEPTQFNCRPRLKRPETVY